MLQLKPKVKRTKTAKQALESLMRMCARSECSSGDALRLMRGWEVPQSEQTEVLRTLIKERYIDDRRYAEAYVREKSSLSVWGEYKIRSALQRKGIAKDIIAEALAQLNPDKDKERLTQRLQKRLRTIKYNNTYQLKTKLIRHGLSLGFSMEQVIESVEDIVRELNLNIECEEEFYI